MLTIIVSVVIGFSLAVLGLLALVALADWAMDERTWRGE